MISNNRGAEYFEEVFSAIAKANSSHQVLFPYGLEESDLPFFKQILKKKHRRLYTLLMLISASRELIVYIPKYEQRTVIKYCRLRSIVNEDVPKISDNHSRLKKITSLFGIRAMSFNFLIENINRSSREHFRIVPPDGTRVVRGHLMTIKDDKWEKVFSEDVPSFTRRIDENMLICYYSILPPGKYVAHIQIMPKLHSFFFPALISAILLSIFAFSAESSLLNSSNNSGSSSFASAVTLLAALPSVFVILIIRNNEHRLVVKLHRVLRTFLLVPALLLLCAAWLIALPGEQNWEGGLPIVTGWLGVACSVVLLMVVVVALTKYRRGAILT